MTKAHSPSEETLNAALDAFYSVPPQYTPSRFERVSVRERMQAALAAVPSKTAEKLDSPTQGDPMTVTLAYLDWVRIGACVQYALEHGKPHPLMDSWASAYARVAEQVEAQCGER